jgi:hypothetical protein
MIFCGYLFLSGYSISSSPRPPRPEIAKISCKEAQALIKRVEDSIYEFSGNFEEIESALGMLFLGKLVGWRVILLIHNSRTIRKYEKILGIKIREEFPEEGPYVQKTSLFRYFYI